MARIHIEEPSDAKAVANALLYRGSNPKSCW
jgi:hypothetical protein